jgi:hypothetical protein
VSTSNTTATSPKNNLTKGIENVTNATTKNCGVVLPVMDGVVC